MKMKNSIIFCLLILTINSYGQNLSCNDFKEGSFTLTSFGEYPMISKVVRNSNSQIETITELPEELKGLNIPMKYYANIEWLTECSYKMTYDETKMELNPLLISYNESGGILVELLEINDNCFFYRSSFKLEGQDMEIKGKLCKD
jgi:hypothetical protein